LSSETSYLSDIFKFRGDDWTDDEGYEDSDIEPDERRDDPQMRSVSQAGSVALPETASRPDVASQNTPRVIKSKSSERVPSVSPIAGPGAGSHTFMTERGDVTPDGSPKLRSSQGDRERFIQSISPPESMGGAEDREIGPMSQASSVKINETRQSIVRGDRTPPRMSPKKKLKRWVKMTFAPLREKLSRLTKSSRKSDDSEYHDAKDNESQDKEETVFYSAAKPTRKKRSITFDREPLIRERVTRYGRKTKVPSRYQD
jgi:hypothetical protein